MKKKIAAVLLTLALLAGCQSQVSASSSAADTPDMESIIRQSVDEAVREKMQGYEEEQRKKDEEIARLKDRLEDLTSQPEVPPEEDEEGPPAPENQPEITSSQTDAPALKSQPEVASSKPTKAAPINEGTVFEGYEVQVNDRTAPAVTSYATDWPMTKWYFVGPEDAILGSISGTAAWDISGRYLPADGSETDWSVWFAEAFNEYRGIDGEGYLSEIEADKDEDTPPQGGSLREADALEIIRLTNEEREKNGLEPLETDEDLMSLAQVRAEEIAQKYSHERPDGTHVAKEYPGCGENIGGRTSAQRQVYYWMQSEGHRANILRKSFHTIGVGCWQDENGSLFWVQVFGK